MLTAMSISRKLSLSFLLICTAALAMMVMLYTNFASIRESTRLSNASQSLYARAQTLETSLLRQNSQLRGFLVTADSTYLKSYEEARVEYDATAAELAAVLTGQEREALLTSQRETLAWRRNWGDRLIARVKRGERLAAEEEVRGAGKAVLVSAAVLPLRAIRDAETSAIERNAARQEGAIAMGFTAMAIGGILLIGLAVVLAVLLTRAISRPVTALTQTMGELAAGRNDVTVPATSRGDELGAMARAVSVFQDAAIAKQAADAAKADADVAQKLVVDAVSTQLARLSEGDLTAQITAEFPAHYAALKTNFNEALVRLHDLIGSVSESAAAIRTGSGEIAQASEDLARRTESNAASLEETAASVAQMDGRLRASAVAATRTVERADQAIATVGGGRAVADEAVQAMGRVSDSAKGIDSVIEGLDKIAFQTRVLAMNAAVEAGRAGDAGRGFAVVADLVSALAMRAEEEAKRARSQLTVTQTDIVTAVEAVTKVDGALANISGDVAQVHELLASMAVDNQAQSAAITQISAAIGTMDQSTQQNAAMVEQTSAAARSLVGEVSGLADQAGRFITAGRGPKRAASRPMEPSRFAGPTRALPAAAVSALVRADDTWKEF
ncbi:methyl-accepting chemotaxis protein [Sphingomonas mucosissima]|uniref:Methyl-accepting chemotaxis protein II n=1 Tax=Sphingomonas mucosissima TaxID=370959 RepID=A0A245ZJJ9_9SPHN|nr:methyl-accepting chemotaxis protein [Sphingomonas mucosissima]OWK29906.1 methyl-accepting chemotaxis protein II [Sphingomonas mucosissima]